MNILVLGSGGREHALAWKLAQSNSLGKLYVAPGNAGTSQVATNLPLAVDDFDRIAQSVRNNDIDMLIVGPEVPLVEGISDYFKDHPELSGIPVIGPSRAAAQLEGSKEFAKAFMSRHNIPTAAYESFGPEDLDKGYRFLETLQPPYVLKADGLAAGKGVLILESLDDAKSELRSMLLDAKFGSASARVVIEEFLSGIELSCFVLTDGRNYKILPTAKDYKRIGEGDTGLNTGGMGAVSPVPFADAAFMEKIENRIIRPTVEGLQREGLPYVGFIFIGLIRVGDDPLVIEYNVRMGDPETEVVIPRIETDLLDLMQATAEGRLDEVELHVRPEAATTVVMVSGGYPEAYEKGRVIRGLEATGDAVVFHAGTRRDESGQVVSSGGRVLAVTAYGTDFREALKGSYRAVEALTFQDAYYRKDIGFDL
ncbi:MULTISPECIES: phosphoribosylamine--glycine ligase [unclassified Robiginitalea]|uniref:phosphoribosylamine--glycine ligase n=1 Tax=Robiginitalea TaxID=252306 RepID=UPI00234A3C38|nr:MULTISPECIES: phosphoribosylamine--glycine ligase [unclassified Robiginitalea]MDC6353206.1 phosphoribosylamine--glycine ligase [Robiginitalea sp. PM2]MDC6373627.1 phosphoribosylamine--glycine ligase [Robiginitalea sp. SP8]